MNELVSIIMPSYNTGKYIEESIKSVINQSYTSWELIIVDDNSSDNSENIISKYLTDERIKFYKNYINIGAALSRNRGLRKAKGRYIAFLDSDDLWYPEKLAKQIKFMQRNEYCFSYTNYVEIDEHGKNRGISVTGPKYISRKHMFNYCWIGCLTVVYDRERVGLIQIIDLKKRNDYAIWLKICKKATCFLLDEELALYRRGRFGSISNHSWIKLVFWHYKLFKESVGLSSISASIFTFRNCIFGFIKKIIYVKHTCCKI